MQVQWVWNLAWERNKALPPSFETTQCMSHPQEALLMPTTQITQHPSRKACHSARLPVKVRQQQLATHLSPSAYHTVNTASSRHYCWLYLSTFISPILSCAESCNLLHRFLLTILAVLWWELTQQLWITRPSYLHCRRWMMLNSTYSLGGRGSGGEADIWEDTR